MIYRHLKEKCDSYHAGNILSTEYFTDDVIIATMTGSDEKNIEFVPKSIIDAISDDIFFHIVRTRHYAIKYSVAITDRITRTITYDDIVGARSLINVIYDIIEFVPFEILSLNDYELCFFAVRICPKCIKQIFTMTLFNDDIIRRLIYEALHIDSMTFKYIPNKYLTDDIIKYTIMYNIDAILERYDDGIIVMTPYIIKSIICHIKSKTHGCPYHPDLLKDITDFSEISDDIVKAALNINGSAIKHVPIDRITDELAIIALKHDKITFNDLPEHYKTVEFCQHLLTTIDRYTDGLDSILKKIPDYVKTYDLCLNVFKREDMKFDELCDVPVSYMTHELIEAAIKKNPCNIKYVPDSSMRDEYIDIVVCNFDMWKITIKYIPDKYLTHDVIMRAVKYSHYILRHIPIRLLNDTIIEQSGLLDKASYNDMLSRKHLLTGNYDFSSLFSTYGKELAYMIIESYPNGIIYIPDEYIDDDLLIQMSKESYNIHDVIKKIPIERFTDEMIINSLMSPVSANIIYYLPLDRLTEEIIMAVIKYSKKMDSILSIISLITEDIMIKTLESMKPRPLVQGAPAILSLMNNMPISLMTPNVVQLAVSYCSESIRWIPTYLIADEVINKMLSEDTVIKNLLYKCSSNELVIKMKKMDPMYLRYVSVSSITDEVISTVADTIYDDWLKYIPVDKITDDLIYKSIAAQQGDNDILIGVPYNRITLNMLKCVIKTSGYVSDVLYNILSQDNVIQLQKYILSTYVNMSRDEFKQMFIHYGQTCESSSYIENTTCDLCKDSVFLVNLSCKGSYNHCICIGCFKELYVSRTLRSAMEFKCILCNNMIDMDQIKIFI